MTNDDHTTLERDLTDLARPSVRDGAFRRTLRGELEERAGVSPPQQARWRRRAPVAMAAAAAVAVLVILLPGTSGTGGPPPAAADVLTLARQALDPPPNTIVHVRMVADDGLYSEMWQLSSPPYAARWIGTLGGGPEVSDDGSKEYVYDEKVNAIYTRPSDGPPGLTGPVSQIRADLDSGRARLAGRATIRGRDLHVVRLEYGYIAYLDPATYRPLFVDEPTRNGGVVRLRVATLEYLPKSRKTMRMLSLTAQHPDAPVESNPAAWGGKP